MSKRARPLTTRRSPADRHLALGEQSIQTLLDHLGRLLAREYVSLLRKDGGSGSPTKWGKR
jgi:hypothetical protein